MNETTPETNQPVQRPESEVVLEELKGSMKQVCQAADRCVRVYPWTSVLLAGLAGMLLGFVLGGEDS